MSRRRAPGEGCVHQRRDGRWQASLQVDGIRRTVYGRTRREVLSRLAELRRQAAASGALPDPGRRTLDELLDTYLATTRPNLKPSTAAHYELLANTYLRPTLGKVSLAKLTPHRIQVNLAKLQDRPRVAQLAYHVLKQACSLAVCWHWLGENPCDRVPRPRYHARRREVWTREELRAFLEGARDHWLYPLWLLLVASGCRLGELCALTWSDVDFDAGTIRVTRTLQRVGEQYILDEPKTASSRRIVALPDEAMAALKLQRGRQAIARLQLGENWRNEHELVFTAPTGAPLHRAVVAHALRRECQRLGVTPPSPHGLRHLHASLLLAEGLPVPAVSARLGHVSPAITMAIYAHHVRRTDDGATAAIGRALSR
jgi:integrase